MLTTPEQTSLTVLELAQAGRFVEIHALFAPQLQALVSAQALRAGWDAELDRLGPVSFVGPPVSEPARSGVVVVKVPVCCERGALTVLVSLTQAGQLAGLQLAPASAAQPTADWEPPGYADPEMFDERELAVGSGPLAVPDAEPAPPAPDPHRCCAARRLGAAGPR